MKISKRKFDVLLIFVIFLFIATFFLAFYSFEKKVSRRKNLEIQIATQQVYFTDEESKVFNLINEYRTKNGLKELKPFSRLQQVSKLKAEDLVKNNYFSHNSQLLGTPFEMIKNQGIDYKIAGENLAGNKTAERAVQAWINSPSHKENILEEKYEYTGICVIESQVYGKVYVQLFMGV